MRFSGMKFLAAVAVPALLLTAGCRSNYPPVMPLGEAGNSGAIEVRRNVQFADLPSPKVFKFNRKYSRNFQGSCLRGGTVVYDGTWNVADTSDWYLREMPKTGWKLRNTVFTNDYDVIHEFVKDDEMIRMRIWHPNTMVLRVEMNIDKTASEAPVRAQPQK